MTHGSLFSGIGGFDLGAEMAGIDTIWNCEIEEFQRKILAKRFPNSKQYVDIRDMSNVEHVDVITGGFPCQDISVANFKAKGIDGERRTHGHTIGVHDREVGRCERLCWELRQIP